MEEESGSKFKCQMIHASIASKLFVLWTYRTKNLLFHQASIVGSVVECSPATRAARVRFPDDATKFCISAIGGRTLLCSIFVVQGTVPLLITVHYS